MKWYFVLKGGQHSINGLQQYLPSPHPHPRRVASMCTHCGPILLCSSFYRCRAISYKRETISIDQFIMPNFVIRCNFTQIWDPNSSIFTMKCMLVDGGATLAPLPRMHFFLKLAGEAYYLFECIKMMRKSLTSLIDPLSSLETVRLDSTYASIFSFLLLQDRFADARALPPIDKQQDYELTSFQESGGKTVLKFNRKFDTCDLRDRKLEVRIYIF